MIIQKDGLRLVDPGQKSVVDGGGISRIGRRTLQQAAVSGKDGGLARAGLKPQNLVGLLLAHGARARRNHVPRIGIRLSVFTPIGKPAVKIRIQ